MEAHTCGEQVYAPFYILDIDDFAYAKQQG
jgi:hypothetical protein